MVDRRWHKDGNVRYGNWFRGDNLTDLFTAQGGYVGNRVELLPVRFHFHFDEDAVGEHEQEEDVRQLRKKSGEIE